jgi:hypothetical protein
MRSQGAAADPIANFVLLENSCVEPVDAVQLKDDATVQPRAGLPKGLSLLQFLLFTFLGSGCIHR